MSRRLMPLKNMSFTQLQDYLQVWKVELSPAIKKVAIDVNHAPLNAGSRRFVRDYLPALQYANTHIDWCRHKGPDVVQPGITATYANGTQKKIPMTSPTTGLAIFDDVVKLLGVDTPAAATAADGN